MTACRLPASDAKAGSMDADTTAIASCPVTGPLLRLLMKRKLRS
jgi:hypothetical protein